MSPLERAKRRFSGTSAGVVGLGREGLALVRFLSSLGASVVGTDDRPLEELAPAARELMGRAELLTGGLNEAAFEADTCFVSPGVPLDLPAVRQAQERGVHLWNETGLFLWLCPAPVVGVTGSSGKSTTSALTAAMLSAAGRRVHLGGNIGRPLIELVGEIDASDAVVMELSSFQLELMRQSPAVAAVTNITPNHLDRHHTMESYTKAKAHICLHQRPGDITVLNADDGGSAGLADRCPGQVHWFGRAAREATGAFLRGGRLTVGRAGDEPGVVCAPDEIPLLGRHNVDNALAACALAQAAGVAVEAMREGVLGFSALPHRLELVAEVGGVAYYNDSIATTPERSLAAVRAVDRTKVLLAGGRDKHLPWDDWAAVVARSVRQVVVFGELAPDLEGLLRQAAVPVQRAADMAEAVYLAKNAARPGEAVLLSPGGTSFDEYRDFEERGDRFRQLVQAMAEGR